MLQLRRRLAASSALQQWVGLSAVVVLFLGLSLLLILQGSPLGHDESVYAIRARSFLEGGGPPHSWYAYRAPGLPVLLQLAWIGSGTEPFLRLTTASVGVVMLLSVWFIGHRMFGVKSATIGVFGLALTPVILTSASQVWPDVPGAALGLLAIAVYVYSIDRPIASAWMLTVPALTFVATMTRFGAPAPIAIGLIGITLWRHRTALASKGLVAITAILTMTAGYIVLYIPAVTAWAQHPNPISPAAAQARLFGDSDFPRWDSFIGYWHLHERLVGGIGAAVLAIGLVAALVVVIRRSDRRLEVWGALGIGVATFVVLALTIHPEARYLVPVIPWFWMVAGYGLARLVAHTGRFLSVAIAVLLLLVVSADTLRRANIQNESNRVRYTQVKTLGRGIDAATTDNECGAISGYGPTIEWYSRCPSMGYDRSKAVVDSPHFGDGPVSLVFILGGKRQPTGAVLDDYLATAIGPVLTAGDPSKGKRQYGEVWVVTDSD